MGAKMVFIPKYAAVKKGTLMIHFISAKVYHQTAELYHPN